MYTILICINNRTSALQRHMFAECLDITSCWWTSILSRSDPSYLLILIDTNSFTNIDTSEREIRDYIHLHRLSILDALTSSCILSMCSFAGMVCSLYRYSIFRVDVYIPVSFNIPTLTLHSILNKIPSFVLKLLSIFNNYHLGGEKGGSVVACGHPTYWVQFWLLFHVV